MIRYQRTRTFEHDPRTAKEILGYQELNVLESEEVGRRYETPDGKAYPSITNVLGVRNTSFLEEWRDRVGEKEAAAVAHHAATRGNFVHDLNERYLNNEEGDLLKGQMPHVCQLFRAAQKVLDASVGKIILQECPLYSDHLKLAGRVDLIAEFDGVLSVVDFKTSKRVKTADQISNYFIQESAYAIMFEERSGIPITQLVTIMVVDGTNTSLVFKEHRDNWTAELIDTIRIFNEK